MSLQGKKSFPGKWVGAVAVIAVALVLYITSPAISVRAEGAVVIPAAAVDNPKASGAPQTAVLAGGCFWGVQGVYQARARSAQSVGRLFRRRQIHGSI